MAKRKTIDKSKIKEKTPKEKKQETKPKRGRKKKIDDNLIKIFTTALNRGASHKIACEAAGISQSSFYRWLKLAEQGKEEYKAFSNSIKGAESHGALKHLENIEKHSMNDWRASAWLLERRYKYTKEGIIEERPKEEEKTEEEQQVLEPIQLLKKQYAELNKAAQNALAIGSFQAYSALKRQELKVAFELNREQEKKGDSLFGDMSDQQVMKEIQYLFSALPAALKQQIENEIIQSKLKL